MAALWLVAGLLLATFSPDLAEALWLGALFVQLAFIATGVVILVASFIALLKSRARAAAVPVLVSLLSLVLYFTFAASIGERLRFAMVRAHYEQRVAEILAASSGISPVQIQDGEIDPGPPLRIAFYWERGVTDNWVGLVYDPTGEVMQANKFRPDWSNWNDQSLAKVKRLFGGDLLRARRLTDNWYLCRFT